MEHQREPQDRTPDDPETARRDQENVPPGRPKLHPVLQLQQDIGNKAVQRLLKDDGTPVQPKLIVDASDDQSEREASRIAQDVMTTSTKLSSIPDQISTQPHAPGGNVASQLSSDRGNLLPESTRAFMESRFGADFSGVRLHTGSDAAELSRSIGAQAFTHGHDIYLGKDSHNLESSAGKELLAHELTHTIQQGAAGSPGSGGQPSIARQTSPTGRTPDWHDQLNELLPKSGLLVHMMRVQTLSDVFGPELPALVNAMSANKEARELISQHGVSAILALGETSPGHGEIDVSRAKAWLATNPGRYSAKNIGAVKEERAPAFPETQPANKITFDGALREGAELLGKARFGLSAGSSAGIDPNDGYDARDWEEGSTRGVLVSKVEPWMAINSIVKNIEKPVPKAGGGSTFWSFDCFDFVTVLRVYAYWRTLSRTEFNTKFGRLELGFFSKSPMQWEQTIVATRPGERPFKSGGTEVVPGTMTFREVKISVGQSWRQLIDSAPVGTQITWANQDAKIKCTKDPNLSFCPYMYENTTKLGHDRYAAHPMGVVNEQKIKEEMAKAVFEGNPVPLHYIEKNIFVSGMRAPIQ
jgi:Domain of unknown function (DUF4157)